MAPPIRLDLEREHVELGAGDTTQFAVTLRNTSDVVEHLHLEVRGLPPGGRARSQPDTVKLLPGRSVSVVVELALERAATADAGTHVLGVLARSSQRREVSRCEEVRLQVAPQPALTLRVEPESVRAGRRASYTASIRNDGNTPLTVALSGTDPERATTWRLEPSHLQLRPRDSAPVAVAVAAPRRWTGQTERRPLTVTATAGELAASQTVALVQPPVLTPALTRSAGAAVAVLVIAGALLARPLLAGDEEGEPDTAPPSAGTEASATPTPTATPTGEPTAPPVVTAPPSPTQSPEPTASGDPSPSPTPSPSPSPSASVPGSVPPPPVTVPFAQAPGGPEPRFVLTDAWREQGVLVSALPRAGASPPGCERADRVAATGSGSGAWISAASSAGPATCNGAALQVRFEPAVAPATDLRLEVAQPGAYVVTLTGPDGQLTTSRVTAPASLALPLPAPQGVTALTLGGDPVAGAPPVVGLSRLQFTPAG